MTRSWIAGTAGLALALVAGPAMAQQKSVKIGFVSTFSGPVAAIGNDMRNAFELALDHLGRKMGGLPVEVIYEDDQQQARSRRAEDREADRIRSCRLPRRLHLVERAVGFAQAGGRFEDHHGRRQCRALADRRRAVLALFLLHLVAERPDARGGRPLHESEGRQECLSARPELRGRQGHAGRPQVDLQGPDRRRGIYALARSARFLRRAFQRARRQTRRGFRVLSGRGRRAVPQSIRAGRPQEPDSALYGVHHRRDDAAAPGRQRDRCSGRTGMGQRSAERRQQEIRRRLQGEVQDFTRPSMAPSPTTRRTSSTARSSP